METSGKALKAPPELAALFAAFYGWDPIAPRTPRQLAETAARLCRLLRDEVAEQLERKAPGLTSLKEDWRKLLFPHASDPEFADGYAQAVTFGLLMAKARGISLKGGIEDAAKALRKSNSLIGSALRLLTEEVGEAHTLDTSLKTLTAVLDVVDWAKLSEGQPEAWLYFYELFLQQYDTALRKRTGSYYTPPQVVTAMVGLVDEALRSPKRFDLPQGLASSDVTLVDPAVGTGTFLLGVLQSIRRTVEDSEGAGSVPAAITAALGRLIGFELQFGPFAVAQLRVLVLVLKSAGLTLSQIAGLVAAGRVEPVALMEAQIAAIEGQMHALERSLGALKAARRSLADGETLGLDALCDLIRRGGQTMSEQAWKAVYDRYYTPDDLARFETAKALFTEADASGYAAAWRDLVARVEAAIAAGVAPGSDEGMALAKAWYDLQAPMVEAVGVGTWNKASAMYQDMEQWRSPAAEPPFSTAVYDYALAAVEAARRAGRVPARAEPA